ncbi:structure-specific endonuclease subunit SLX4 [Tachyglossus aculeatus]|uniref:structure-specific endonuclease subunit SLX4 n=1 Tax=Tachyglossus aculeatus TaxID=9261 RepID=UPI0018F33844|nr:structure-specific endonuclease subunit SLX4 [Tachyglossus aculeatus]
MEESDDDFKELWSNLPRVRKKEAKEWEGGTRTQKEKSSVQPKSRLRRTKVSDKSGVGKDSRGKTVVFQQKPSKGDQALGNGEPKEATSHASENTPVPDGKGDVPSTAQRELGPQGSEQDNLTVATINGHAHEAATHSAVVVPPQPATIRPRAAELVLQRMQRFKRADPERLKHTPGDYSAAEAVFEAHGPDIGQADPLENEKGPGLSTMESDAALALALQREFGQERPSENSDSLEQKGLFFCQICQKDLSAMNATRREQHVNRCLDDAEKSPEATSNSPRVPDCPICGKLFVSFKSRTNHMKRCAVKMEVPPQVLLQAVRLQALESDSCPPALRNPDGRAKRKGSTKEREPHKRRKTSKTEVMSEDLLVAMAMSRSLLEEAKTVLNVKMESGLPDKIKPGAEKKSRKKQPGPPPPLLVQDPATTLRQIQDRVAGLFTEEVELSSTPPLRESRILDEEMGRADWCLPQPQRKHLWEGSALSGDWALEAFYAAGLVPPILPWQPLKSLKEEPILPLVATDKLKLPAASEGFGSQTSDEPIVKSQSSSCSRDHQVFQDLVDLAGEGLTLTQWNLPGSGEPSGKDLMSDDIPLTGFVASPREKQHQESSSDLLVLSSLASDLGAMINNPHLSDVQFQVDCGEVLYAHMFVLYARCPCLVQIIHSEGFLVEEDGDLRSRRVLLNEVTSEAVLAFLRYLYAADTSVPPHLLSDLASLAVRFGVSELVDICERGPKSMGAESEGDVFCLENEDETCETRADHFQELLRSMWVEEEEEGGISSKPEDREEEDAETINEDEMEEIYEFAATQRKILRGQSGPEEVIRSETEEGEEAEQPGEEKIQVSECLRASNQVKEVNLDRVESPRLIKENQDCTVGDSLNAEQFTLSSQGKPCNGGDCGRPPGNDTSVKATEEEDDSSSSEIAWEGKAGGPGELPSPHLTPDAELENSYVRLFSVTQGEYNEPSQTNSDPEKPKESVAPQKSEACNSPDSRQSSSPEPEFLLSKSNCVKSSPVKSPLPPLPQITSSPLFPTLKRLFSSVASQIQLSPGPAARRKKSNSFLTQCDDLVQQNESDRTHTSGCQITQSLTSPVKSLSIDLTEPKSVSRQSPLVTRSQNSTTRANQDDDIILLLDSDEETEQEETHVQALPAGFPGEKEMPQSLMGNLKMKDDPDSSGPLSAFDTDENRRRSSCSVRGASGVLRDGVSGILRASQSNGQKDGWMDGKLNLVSPELERTHEASSSTDTSWLIPATPVANRSRECSVQTQITSVRSRSRASTLMARDHPQRTETSVGNGCGKEATKDLSVRSPQTASRLLSVISKISPLSEDCGSKGQPSASSSNHYSEDQKSTSPVASSPSSCERAGLVGEPLNDPPSPQARLSHAEETLPVAHGEVVEVEDSEEEEEAAPSLPNASLFLDNDPPVPVDDDCWAVDCFSPVPLDSLDPKRIGPLKTSSPSGRIRGASDDRQSSSPRSPKGADSTPLCGNPADRKNPMPRGEERALPSGSPEDSRGSLLNSAIWEDWNGEDEDLPVVLPLSQRLLGAEPPRETEVLKTPKVTDPKKNLPPKVPITPMPRYSIMETPKLKKELDRFGVRPLPKRQMVLKLKEIFQYTHQILESDSEEEVPSSQVPPQKVPAGPCCLSQTSPCTLDQEDPYAASSSSSLPSLENGCPQAAGDSSRASQQRLRNTTKTRGSRVAEKQPSPAILPPPKSPAKEVLPDPEEDGQPSASQSSSASSGAENDSSFGSQSSSTSEFGAGYVSEGEEEVAAEDITASQAALLEADKEEAVRRYIRSSPALYRKILLYQPLELGELQAELKQNGIKLAAGKLLDFLDTQGITFTTARARKEKLEKKQRRNPGAKKRGRRY